jgi:hypothetical protein
MPADPLSSARRTVPRAQVSPTPDRPSTPRRVLAVGEGLVMTTALAMALVGLADARAQALASDEVIASVSGRSSAACPSAWAVSRA